LKVWVQVIVLPVLVVWRELLELLVDLTSYTLLEIPWQETPGEQDQDPLKDLEIYRRHSKTPKTSPFSMCNVGREIEILVVSAVVGFLGESKKSRKVLARNSQKRDPARDFPISCTVVNIE
jgi:hypothetical protein